MTEQAVHTRGPAFPGKAAGPGGTAGFLGRRDELSTLRADTVRAGLSTLAGRPAPRSRVLLIVGRPGTGRTALAEEFVRRHAASGDFPDGVLRARLTDPGGTPVPNERTARELLSALGLVAPPGADEDELTEALRTALAERGALLLLDDVATSDQLNELTPDSRGCLVVAVARGPLTG
ncbi:ATP-binding protein, partial [Streptomyces sp. SM12]|uniref:ATP-binding protein n=1 Tax=Streptomyces sp. SM12 TaxID=1071602 RepID=UPI0015E17248